MTIHSLGYLGISTQDTEAWRRFGTDVLGLQDVSEAMADPAGTVYLKMDEDPYRLFIASGETDQLTLCGWEVVSESALRALTDSLSKAGTAWEWGTDETCAQRGCRR